MKKIVITVLLSIGLLITLVFLFKNFWGYRDLIDRDFGVCFLNLEKLKEQEEWSPNGDGIKIQIFQYQKYEETSSNLSNLPIKEKLPPNEIPKDFINTVNGHYKCVFDKEDKRNFNILIIDTLKKKICVYHQVM